MAQKHITPDKPIGLVTWEEIEHLVKDEPWEPVPLVHNAFAAMTLPPTYLFSLGRAAISGATTSISGLTYFVEENVFRTDKEEGKMVIDIDRYLISHMGRDRYLLVKSHHTSFPYHHPHAQDPMIQTVPIQWRAMVQNVLKEGRQ